MEKFSLVYEKTDSNDDDAAVELKYFCACNKCRKVYAYKASDGKIEAIELVC